MEALVTLHNKYSDRKLRAKSRIKFLVERFGAEGFIEKYREEFERTRQALANKPYPQGKWRLPHPQSLSQREREAKPFSLGEKGGG